jgi:hypothetical protein
VPEAEITLNAAARRLAWGPHERFHRYRQIDASGHQRVNRTLRDAIIEACQACVTITEGACARGFLCNLRASPITLRRFEQSTSAVDLAAETPEFMEDA